MNRKVVILGRFKVRRATRTKQMIGRKTRALQEPPKRKAFSHEEWTARHIADAYEFG